MHNNITEIVTHLVFQFALILLAAKVAGEVCERWLKVPPVLGELMAGVLIGPFALGQLPIPGLGPLFPLPEGYGHEGVVIPVSTELWSLAQVGAVILLFQAGLETNAGLFFRYAGPGLAVAAGGVLLPFAFGAAATVAFGFADGFTDPAALFMGAILTATSVGITARVLTEIGKLDSAEGVTVLAAAVLDDILGILVLTVVVGISVTGAIAPGAVALVAVKAVGFWIALTGLGTLFSRWISSFALSFRSGGASLGIALALAMLASGLAETFGLAMIIGAYSIGLALSNTRLAHDLQDKIHEVSSALVPVFFVVMGALVDVSKMANVLLLGTVMTALAIAGKFAGAGLPSLAFGFNTRGALRIGVGMIPRGEVALIVAGVGLSNGVIGTDLFGVSIMMTVVTTIVAPILLVPLFNKGGEGRRAAAAPRPTSGAARH